MKLKTPTPHLDNSGEKFEATLWLCYYKRNGLRRRTSALVESLNCDRLNYVNYLKVDELLSLQHRLSGHHDEMLFIVIHQIYELWFKEILHELAEVVRCFQVDDVARAIKVIHRVLAIQQVLVKQIDVLETMTPTEFAEFRDNLRPASGFQSVQFREIEFWAGLKQPEHLKMLDNLPEAKARLERRMQEPTLYDRFIQVLAKRGYAIDDLVLSRDYTQPYQLDDSVLSAIHTIYKAPEKDYEMYRLCEALISFDEQFGFWRYRHVKMVERTIGMKTGTGGSSGAKYLASTLSSKFFPELWEVRNLIGTY